MAPNFLNFLIASHAAQLCEKLQADLQVVWEVVEQNDLQQQLLSSDDVGRQIQGQEEILEHCELQERHMETVSAGVNNTNRTINDTNAKKCFKSKETG